jgi:hypothetical protein
LDLVARLLSKEPGTRPISADAALEELARVEQGKPTARAAPAGPRNLLRIGWPWLPIGFGSAVCFVAVLLVLGMGDPEPEAPTPPKIVQKPAPLPPPPPPEPPPTGVEKKPDRIPLPAPPEKKPEPPPAPIEPPKPAPVEKRPEPPPPPPVVEEPKPPPPPPPSKGVLLLSMHELEMSEGVYFGPESGKKGRPLPNSPADMFRVMEADRVPSPCGIGMHPMPQGPSQVTFALDRKYATFRGRVTQNDGPREGPESPMTFTILGDGTVLWRSKPVASRKDAQPFQVSVKGVQKLRLEVGCSGGIKAAHGLWFEPTLE